MGYTTEYCFVCGAPCYDILKSRIEWYDPGNGLNVLFAPSKGKSLSQNMILKSQNHFLIWIAHG